MADEMTPIQEDAAPVVEAAPVEAPAKKTRRTRTKKAEEPAPAADPEQTPSPEQPADAAPVEAAPEAPAKKTRRTRTKKAEQPAPEALEADVVASPAVQEKDPAPVAEPTQAPSTDQPAEAPKRRRGRPRKNPLPEPAAADEGGLSEKESPLEDRSAETPSPAAAAVEAPVAAPEPAPAPAPESEVTAEPVEAPEAELAETPAEDERKGSRTARSRKRRGQQDAGNPARSEQTDGSKPAQTDAAKNGKAKKPGNQAQAQQQQQQQQNGRRKRRGGYDSPAAMREALMEIGEDELRDIAVTLELDHSAFVEKDALVDAVLDAQLKKEGYVEISGLLDIMPEGYGFLRTGGYLPGEKDVYVGQNTIKRNGLRRGDLIAGQSRPVRENEKYPALHRIDSVNGRPLAESFGRPKFSDLTPIYPDQRLKMEHGKNTITARTIDLVAPIGKGQRGLIVSPPKAGKTTILKDIAAAISANDPDVHLMCLLVDERPEEVTDMQRSIKGEVISSTFDMPCENHIAVAELVIERAKRLVELGADVVILLDSITRLARAYNLAQPASGRILSGGVDSTALYPPKRFLGAARNIEFGGSLTILASALIDTGSKMDEVIFEEFTGTGIMELRLERALADRRIFPAIDPVASGTRKEELLLDPQSAPLIWGVRRILANMNNTERCMDMLIKSLKQTDDNQDFLIRMAKKAQTANGGNLEF
ncbi:MAG: transcription termination factor Rho [Coriobacteriales bacterium]|nr:transcription termination factor Rho [Coriobacteriales bacterium]